MDLSKVRTSNKRKTPKRLGRGSGSGWGKRSGRGDKGAGSRSGKVLPYIGFNGGNVPYARKIPKRGFNTYKKDVFQVVNLCDIQESIKNVSEVDAKVLKEARLINDVEKPVKILADIKEKLSLKATFKVDSFSAKAKKAIEDAGGKAECLKR